ncbi:hypothetical protein AX17_001894 [Amanita inopinata Kibby_2008]|nr:hypothetical protein AX17_001894 [Amanita inopinata Kibby_2008]
MLRVLHWSRSIGHRFFLRFGLHCATHQIRVILISCIVITSLFYPALAIYSSSQPRWLSLVDAFAAQRTTSGFHAPSDLVNLWSGHDALRLHEDSVSRVKCGAGRALRVEQLLIQDPSLEDANALDKRLLAFTLDLDARLSAIFSVGDNPCLKRDDGHCFVISPSLFWNHDQDALLADANILETLNSFHNVTMDGITITSRMVLAGRTSSEHRVGGCNFDFARFLALTYFFPESDCLSVSEHAFWKHSVQDLLSQDADVEFHLQEPALIALEYDPSRSHAQAGSGLATFVNLAYIGFFVYVAWSVRRMDAVHSRLGVTFTALVEIAVSTITSLSVCALVGFKITMVPWELLPIVIVFVGAENMFNLVDAVGRTSVTLSVKQRIAEGLSHAGTSNTLKVLSYIAILGLIAVFSLAAVRQFCIFAIVVLVAHWFLAHTFFMAVLSIDIQRLELEELLRHDTSLIPSAPQQCTVTDAVPTSRWGRLVKSTQALLKGRAATNISLLMLLAITAALYYLTYSSSLSTYDPLSRSSFPMNTVNRVKTSISIDIAQHSMAWGIWRKLNPNQQPMLHLRIEKPSIITLLPDSSFPYRLQDAKSLRLRLYMRTFRLILWLLQIMILPIAGTTSMLWVLLRYLLKDAELLEAQRHRAGPDSPELNTSKNSLERSVSFSTIPRPFISDVELVASSKDGQTIVFVGLHNELTIWRAASSSIITIDVEEMLLAAKQFSSTPLSITAVAVDEEGEYLAIGTKTGVIAVWESEAKNLKLLPLLCLDGPPTGVSDLRCINVPVVMPERPSASEPNAHIRAKKSHAMIIATLQNGSVVKWEMEDSPIQTFLMSGHKEASVSKASFASVVPNGLLAVAYTFDDGWVELLDVQNDKPLILPDCCFQAGNSSDLVTDVHICQAKLRGTTKLVAAMATSSGKVSLWDLNSKEQICEVGNSCCDQKRHLKVVPVLREICHICGYLPPESLIISFAVEQGVALYQLLLYDQVRYCSCSIYLLQQPSSCESLSGSLRNDSITSQLTTGVHSLRLRLSNVPEMDSFPISGHGVYPRRASESGRRSSEALKMPYPGEDYESIHILGANVSKPPSQTSFWRYHSVTHFIFIPCEKGDWGVILQRFVGVRRRERLKQQNVGVRSGPSRPSSGLPISTLERWELWTFDPATLRLQTSTLSRLVHRESAKAGSPGRLLQETIPRMPFTRVAPLILLPSHAVACFGNTVGVFDFSDS